MSLRLPPIPVGGDNFKIQIPIERCLKPLYCMKKEKTRWDGKVSSGNDTQ